MRKARTNSTELQRRGTERGEGDEELKGWLTGRGLGSERGHPVGRPGSGRQGKAQAEAGAARTLALALCGHLLNNSSLSGSHGAFP